MNEAKLFGKYHDFVLIIMGFILTTVAGGFIGHYLQHRSWKADNITKEYYNEINNSTQTFEDISRLMDKRLYRTRLIVWAALEGDREAVKERRKLYREMLFEWNDSLNRNLARIHRYFGEDMRLEFENDISNKFVYFDGVMGGCLKKRITPGWEN